MTELMIIAVGLFLANRWNTMLVEIIEAYFPAGQKLGEKLIFNLILTFLLVYGVLAMLRFSSQRRKPVSLSSRRRKRTLKWNKRHRK